MIMIRNYTYTVPDQTRQDRKESLESAMLSSGRAVREQMVASLSTACKTNPVRILTMSHISHCFTRSRSFAANNSAT